MTTPQFDTLRAAKTLKRGGFNETQAETVVNTLDQAVNENLGTKTDLKLLQAEVKQGFTETNAATEQGFTEANAATDKLRSDTKQAFTEANAATKQAITDANAATKQGFADAKTANDKLLAEIDKKFAALYRFLSVFGAALVAIMIALFVAQ